MRSLIRVELIRSRVLLSLVSPAPGPWHLRSLSALALTQLQEAGPCSGPISQAMKQRDREVKKLAEDAHREINRISTRPSMSILGYTPKRTENKDLNRYANVH